MELKRQEAEAQKEKILECSRALAQLIKTSTEFVSYKKAKAVLLQHEDSMNLLADFRALQMKLQLTHLEQKENSALEKELDNMYFTLSMHQEINDFLTAEYCLSKLLDQIQKVFVEDLDMQPEQTQLLHMN